MTYTDTLSSPTDRDRLILDHLKLCTMIARQVSKTLPVHIELDDLIHAGVLGLLDAVDKYQLGRKVQFSSYAKYRIRGAIFDSLRKGDFASRDLRRRCKKVEAATRELCAALQRDPTEEEVAGYMDIDIARLRKLKLDAYSIGHVSTSYTWPKDDELVERDLPGKEDTRPDYMLMQVRVHTALKNALKPLRPRQQQVVLEYYSGDKTMKEIGQTMGINESRVSQLHKSALENMQIALRAQGVNSCGAF